MKGIVEQYARGEFNVERPDIEISITKLELAVEAGSVYNGTFKVVSKNDVPIKLMVYDSRYLFDFKSHTFVGRRNTVAFSFDASGIEHGQSFKGHINIITDGGEFKIPYSVEIVSPYILAGDKRIEDLFQFAMYAEENWNDALTIFDSKEFVRTFLMEGCGYQRRLCQPGAIAFDESGNGRISCLYAQKACADTDCKAAGNYGGDAG